MDNCARCNQQLQGIMVSDKDGWICEKCYYVTHPFKPYLTFSSVLLNVDDQVLLRNLLEIYVPSDVKLRIREKFNEVMKQRYNQRCSDLGLELQENK